MVSCTPDPGNNSFSVEPQAHPKPRQGFVMLKTASKGLSVTQRYSCQTCSERRERVPFEDNLFKQFVEASLVSNA